MFSDARKNQSTSAISRVDAASWRDVEQTQEDERIVRHKSPADKAVGVPAFLAGCFPANGGETRQISDSHGPLNEGGWPVRGTCSEQDRGVQEMSDKRHKPGSIDVQALTLLIRTQVSRFLENHTCKSLIPLA